jgi:hypothetical protein
MGILDSLKKGAKKLAETVKERYQESQAIKNWKTTVARTLTFPQIKQLCNEYGSSPKPYEIDPLIGKKEKRILNRDAYEDFIINEVPSKFILKFIQEHHIDVPPYPEFEKEEKATQQIQQEVPVKGVAKEDTISTKGANKETAVEANREGIPQVINKPNNFELVLEYIDKEFREFIKFQEVSDERDFLGRLINALKGRFPDVDIEDVSKEHKKGDIRIDKEYVLELKYAKREDTLIKGMIEVKDYYVEQHYKGVAVIILDIGSVNPITIKKYKEEYEKSNARVIILNAKAKQQPKRNKNISIKF